MGKLPDEGVIFVLYKKGNEKFLIQIAQNGRVLPENLPGSNGMLRDITFKYITQSYVKNPTGPVEPSVSSVIAGQVAIEPLIKALIRTRMLARPP